MTIQEYIRAYGEIKIEEKKGGFMFFSDGKDRIGGKVRAGDLKKRGMI